MRPITILCCAALAVVLPSSCIDEVQLPIRNETPKLVVEGLVTNEPGPYRVRLTYSGEFLSAGQLPPELSVSNAEVFIRDDAGNRTRLDATRSPGFYQTVDSSFVGQVGRTYTLSVRLPDGRQYVSKPERMLPVPPIDTVYAEFVTINNPGRNYAYDIFVDTRDASQSRDYYRWTAFSYHLHRSVGVPCSAIGPALCFIACWYPTYSRNVNIFSDVATNGQTLRKRFVLRSPVYYLGNHLVEVSQYSMSREAFQFWRLYQEQAARTGSIFDPLPASVEGNMANAEDPDDIALGFFAASAVSKRRYVVPGDETYNPKIVYYIDSLRTYPRGNCLDAFPGSTLERPPGW